MQSYAVKSLTGCMGSDRYYATRLYQRHQSYYFLHDSWAHMQVADFQWVPSDPPDPFAMASVSDNGVGGTLQLWRINDMIWRPEDEVLAEMEEHRCFPHTHRPRLP